MALSPRLDLRQSQSLVMTPQLQQAIRLLTLSNLELEAALADEIAKNPLLDSGSEGIEEQTPARGADAAVATDTLFESGVGAAEQTLDADYAAETFHHDSASDSEWKDAPRVAEGPSSGGEIPSGSSGSGEAIDFDSFGGPDETLHDHLLAQAGEALSGIDFDIARILIESIDEAGYLDANLSELAIRLGLPTARLEAVLTHIQSFDPSGVGVRSLSECIAIQARDADRYDPMMARLIDNLDLLARGEIARLRRMCGADEEDMTDMIRELRGYDPKPGLRFSSDEATPITPDLFVRPTPSGWAVEINSATLPRVLVNRQYYAELSRVAGKGAQKAWLTECLASANWLIKALDQRQQTIIKVGFEIVRQQEGFFLHGVDALKPLTLHQVAETVGLHESTISRVTSNKYLSCPRGIFELKYFFSSGVMGQDGEGGMSAEAVKGRIKALIDAEDGKAILSDDALVELLVKDGCEIARRTVAKYREAMGIGSSVQRRRAKAIGR
ncbi:MAG: RNA polymerase factor sigma-54 [Pseudomonadota bacterium]